LVRLIYHCGFLKTGTTAIQTVLAKARAALEAEGIFYPRLDESGIPGHWSLGALWQDALPKGHPMHRRLMALGGGAVAQARVTAKLEATVEAARKSGGVVLLSDEILSLGVAKLGRQRLNGLFDRLGVDAQILAYARRDTDLLASRVQQRVKSYRALPRLWDASHCDALAGIQADFPGRRLHLRIFHPEALVAGDIWQDFRAGFAAMTGVSMGDHGPAPRVNEAISAPGTALLTQLNALGIEADGPIGADPAPPGFALLRQLVMQIPGPKLILPEALQARLAVTQAGPWNALLAQATLDEALRARLRLVVPEAPALTRGDLIAWVMGGWDRDWLQDLAARLGRDPRPLARGAEALLRPLLDAEYPRMPLAWDDNLD
jgi:hypothetical protein